eukprot:1156462-Pelagomonas_calceolata.AAC.4
MLLGKEARAVPTHPTHNQQAPQIRKMTAFLAQMRFDWRPCKCCFIRDRSVICADQHALETCHLPAVPLGPLGRAQWLNTIAGIKTIAGPKMIAGISMTARPNMIAGLNTIAVLLHAN